MVVKRSSQRQITFMGVDSTTDKQTTALSNPMNMLWRCDPPLYTMFLKALTMPTFVEISPLRGLADLVPRHSFPDTDFQQPW